MNISANAQREVLYLAAVGLACVAVIDAITTYAIPGPTRPRALALSLAGISALACAVGVRRLSGIAFVDVCLALAADAWVLIDAGW